MSCERELIAQAARGDETAVLTLYTQHKTAVYTYVYYRAGGDHVLAEEITAEVFMRLVARLPHFVYRGRPLLAWLYTVARHCLADHFRRSGRFTRQPLSEKLPAQTTSPEQYAQQSLAVDHLAQAISRLTEAQRDVIILRFIEGRSVAETAELLGKKEGSVKTLTRRALAALHRQLHHEPDHE
ncbi:RNA polymerase sigma factor [Candidatus Leptofilum sp.]|uniref:RNA polymerase sigma factor n=1 Tax=Candidatus Leptofilum sp. TaxID=3241576 RepID=UPI003B5CD310